MYNYPSEDDNEKSHEILEKNGVPSCGCSWDGNGNCTGGVRVSHEELENKETLSPEKEELLWACNIWIQWSNAYTYEKCDLDARYEAEYEYELELKNGN